uniref:Pyruvate kinase n=2 Tax=Drosophila rhopaloa TaxID=1041015 RepID=A0A6P4EEM9_DRORH
MIHAGMRVVRINFSHGTHEYHCKTIQAARKAISMYVEQTGLPRTVAIALDTKGPEIRTGKLAGGSDTAEIELKAGDKITLSTKKELEANCTKEKIYVDYQRLPSVVKPGNLIFVDDGLIALMVKESTADEVICQVENGGKLGSRKGINLPGIPVDLPAVTEQDKRDLKFGAEQQVDMIFASFIRDAKALTEMRQALGPKGEHIKIIAKIENHQGLAHIDEIIREFDGIMVARGDMGIEIPTEDVPLAQKSIVAKCNKVGKPVICATQMMDSMMTKPRPTRAEATDVANAIFDGCDAVMLSGETAKGKYPVECVQCMARICAKVEAVLWYECLRNSLKREIRTSAADHISAVTTAIAEAATVGQARAIVVASPCSMVAQMVSHMRPPCPIVMLTGCQSQAAHSLIFRGVYPLLVEEMVHGSFNFRCIIQSGLKLIAKLNILEPGQMGSMVLVNAMSADQITFRLFHIRQQTTAEQDQEEHCRKLALEQRCKEMALKKKCQKLKPEQDCQRKREEEECSQKRLTENCATSEENLNVCPKKECPQKDDYTSKCKQLKKERQAQAEAEKKRKEESEKSCEAKPVSCKLVKIDECEEQSEKMSYKVEAIPGSHAGLGEGPHWDVDTQSLYYVDLDSAGINRYDFKQNKVYKAKIEGETFASFILPIDKKPQEFAVGCARRVSIVKWDGVSAVAKVVRTLFEVESDLKDNRINDAKTDPNGRFYGGTMSGEGDIFKQWSGNLYSWQAGGQPKRLREKVGISNGLAWDTKAKKFYYVDTNNFEVVAYDYNQSTGDVSNPKVIFDLRKIRPEGPLYPDGMTVDTEGNIYVATFHGGSVFKVNPSTGKILLEIKIPTTQITSVAFGGPNLDILYVTTAQKFDVPDPAGTTYQVTGLNAKGYPGVNLKI